MNITEPETFVFISSLLFIFGFGFLIYLGFHGEKLPIVRKLLEIED